METMIVVSFGGLKIRYVKSDSTTNYNAEGFTVYEPQGRPFNFATAVTDAEADYRTVRYDDAPEVFMDLLREAADTAGVQLPYISEG